MRGGTGTGAGGRGACRRLCLGRAVQQGKRCQRQRIASRRCAGCGRLQAVVGRTQARSQAFAARAGTRRVAPVSAPRR